MQTVFNFEATPKGKNKAEKLKNYLKENRTITSWQAITILKITRLSGYIYNLKAKGWKFKTTEENQNGSRFAVYELLEVPEK